VLDFQLCKVTCWCGLCSKSDSFKSAGKGLQSMPQPLSDPICCRCCCEAMAHVCRGYDLLSAFPLHAGTTEGDGWSYRPAFRLGSWYTPHLSQVRHDSLGTLKLCCKTMCAPSSRCHHGCCCPLWLASCNLLSQLSSAFYCQAVDHCTHCKS